MSDFRKDVFFANGGSDHHTAEQNREMTEWQDSEITRLQGENEKLRAAGERLKKALNVEISDCCDQLPCEAMERGDVYCDNGASVRDWDKLLSAPDTGDSE